MMEHDHLCDRMSWQQPFDHGTGAARRGRGLAIALKAAISPTTSVAALNVAVDGSVTLLPGFETMKPFSIARELERAGWSPKRVGSFCLFGSIDLVALHQ
jgi:hypothetical protein